MFVFVTDILQVEDDDHELGRVPMTKRPRYSPLPVLMSGHDEPSSSHCPSPGPGPSHQSQQELRSLQARLSQREAELEQQRTEAEAFLRELQESVMCPVCLSIPRQPPVPCCQNGHVICAKCKERVEVRTKISEYCSCRF